MNSQRIVSIWAICVALILVLEISLFNTSTSSIDDCKNLGFLSPKSLNVRHEPFNQEPNWNSYPIRNIKSALYPASGEDATTIKYYLDNLPSITDVYLVDSDRNVLRTFPFWRLTNWDEYLLENLSSYGVELYKTKKVDIGITYRDGRKVILHFRAVNFLEYKPLSNEEKFDLVIVHYPGWSGSLSESPLFWKRVIARTRPEGLISVNYAYFPFSYRFILAKCKLLFKPSYVSEYETATRWVGYNEVFLLQKLKNHGDVTRNSNLLEAAL